MENKIENKPLVTVLMPCYNAMPYLPEALESIIYQTYSNLEILCINDGSTDETSVVLERYAAQDKRIRVVHNETNLKLIATLNKGIELAQGKFIARMDADDISHPKRLETLVNEIEHSNSSVLSSLFNFIHHNNPSTQKGYVKCYSNIEIDFGSYFYTPIAHPAVLGKTEIFTTFKYSMDKHSIHCEDYELWTRMIRSGVKMKNTSDVLFSIRINNESVSRKFEATQIENFCKIAANHQSILLERELNIETVRIAVNRIDFTKSKSINYIQNGFTLIDEITTKFLAKHEFNKQNRREIKTISDIQKLDISFQLAKLGSFKLKCFGIINIFIITFKNCANKRFMNYLKFKLWK